MESRFDYFPDSGYNAKIMRNFYKFLLTGIDEAIYRSIYRTWGIPWKTKYVSVCRKCPKCYSYIDDPKAKYCPYCGSEIERHVMYRNMFERLEAQQKFHQIKGISHLGYPFAAVDRGRTYQRLTVCPTCLNHEFTREARYCRICGQLLVNEDTPQLEDCFSRDSGVETAANSWYPDYESRVRRLMAYRGIAYDEEWIDYDYWEFTKFMMRGVNSKVSMDLQSATLYTHAFSDDDDDVIIITDTEAAANIIRAEKDTVLSFLKETDDIDRDDVEVLVVDDL